MVGALYILSRPWKWDIISLKMKLGDITETSVNGAGLKFFSPASVVLYTFPLII